VPICPVLSWEAPEGSQPAFAPGDVVDGTDATGIPLLFTEEFEVVIMIDVVTEEMHGSD
jgi:hypothetical protein